MQAENRAVKLQNCAEGKNGTLRRKIAPFFADYEIFERHGFIQIHFESLDKL